MNRLQLVTKHSWAVGSFLSINYRRETKALDSCSCRLASCNFFLVFFVLTITSSFYIFFVGRRFSTQFFPSHIISFCGFNLSVYFNINIYFKENATNQVMWKKIVTERVTTERNFTAFISRLVIFPIFDFIIKMI